MQGTNQTRIVGWLDGVFGDGKQQQPPTQQQQQEQREQ